MAEHTPPPQGIVPVNQDFLRFKVQPDTLAADQFWEYDAGSKRSSRDIAAEAFRSLSAPDDFPPIEAAIVSGDKVALAVDPNIPNVDRVLEGTLRRLRSTPAEQVE